MCIVEGSGKAECETRCRKWKNNKHTFFLNSIDSTGYVNVCRTGKVSWT